MKKILLKLVLISTVLSCSNETNNSKYFLHKNCCYSVPVGLEIQNNQVGVFDLKNESGRKKIQSLKYFKITSLGNGLLEFHINDNSIIPNTKTYKYSDLNGVWDISSGLLVSKESELHYFKPEKEELFIK